MSQYKLFFQYNPETDDIVKIDHDTYAVVSDGNPRLKSSDKEFDLVTKNNLAVLACDREFVNDVMAMIKKYSNDQELGTALRSYYDFCLWGEQE